MDEEEYAASSFASVETDATMVPFVADKGELIFSNKILSSSEAASEESLLKQPQYPRFHSLEDDAFSRYVCEPPDCISEGRLATARCAMEDYSKEPCLSSRQT
jgi:hypothetical protein